MIRIAIGIEYDGSGFFGWQTQAQEPTVQHSLEQALSQVADEPVTVHGAGRTDTGVHARQQVAHFETLSQRPDHAWVRGTNRHLPADLCLLWATTVPVEFHARFSALARVYRYTICNRPVRPVLGRLTQTWVGQPLAEKPMHAAAQALTGEHDYTSFRATACQARHAVRRIHKIVVSRCGEQIVVTIEGNAFLHHMVRNIVGSLLEVGLGKRPVEWIGQVLEQRDRKLAGATAVARGLCLDRIRYPAQFKLPDSESAP